MSKVWIWLQFTFNTGSPTTLIWEHKQFFNIITQELDIMDFTWPNMNYFSPHPVSAYREAHSDPDQHSHPLWSWGLWNAEENAGRKTNKFSTKSNLAMDKTSFSFVSQLLIRVVTDFSHTWNFSLQVPTLTSVPQITSLCPAPCSLPGAAASPDGWKWPDTHTQNYTYWSRMWFFCINTD